MGVESWRVKLSPTVETQIGDPKGVMGLRGLKFMSLKYLCLQQTPDTRYLCQPLRLPAGAEPWSSLFSPPLCLVSTTSERASAVQI
jgi:hypothetical protein